MSEIEFFPDGTPIDEWFYDTAVPEIGGKRYTITDYGVRDDGRIYTEQIQSVIDMAAENGGVVVVPNGTYMTGALFFTGGAHLHIEKGGVLKGSDSISDYPVCDTRIEGEWCKYFAALINADGMDGFTISGEGTIDGSGERSWRAFWERRKWNRACTNKDEQRARLVFVSNCTNVCISGVTLQNSQFWTTHLYKCSRVKILNCRILSPHTPIAAPSTDAIDVDVCTDVLIKGCYMNVNDDAVALKGGKGMTADTAPENGANERVIIEDCRYGFCHGCLTCGSESVHNKNVILRRIQADDGYNLLWLKMRPDTPQLYEYIRVEDIQGKINNFININAWTQFCKEGEACPSYAENITVQRCECECRCFVCASEQHNDMVKNVKLADLKIKAHTHGAYLDGVCEENVSVEIQEDEK